MRIRNRREELRLTQRELSERAKLSQAYLSQLEQGKFEPTAPTIIRLARSLLLSADELLGMNEKKTEKDERRAV
ncbi:MAG: helix-turn-helix domain-containing protein [Oscillospiraceae bacterium]|nr:helix-turn-helix domain-containing protein [Oscillospiraceae bacterium]